MIADAEFLSVDAGPLGMVHGGFYRDARQVFAAVRTLMVGKIIIVGHSLGASRAALSAGLCAIDAISVDELYMFEPARPGFDKLGQVVQTNCNRIIGTRNARDFVPDLAPDFSFPYKHVIDLIDLNPPATDIDPIQHHLLPAVTAGVLKRWPLPCAQTA